MAQSLEVIKASFDAPTHKIVNGVQVDLTAEEVEATLNSWAENELARQLDEEANGYKIDRANEYPSIVDQLDDIFHNGLDAWKATIQTTKDKYPKGQIMSSILKVDNIQEKTASGTIQLGNTVSEDVTAVTSSSGTLTLDASVGGFFTVALSENITTWTISNLPAGRATVITVRFTQDSTDRTVVSTINTVAAKTAGGGGWTMSTGSGVIDIVTVLYDGTNYYLVPQQAWS